MTSPTNVGSVEVDLVLSEAKALAKQIREGVEKSFKGADLGKTIRDSVGDKPIRVPVEADGEEIAEQVSKTRAPKVKVPLDPQTQDIPEKVKDTPVPPVRVPMDPLIAALRDKVRTQVQALSRQVELKVPMTADGQRLRAELGAQLAAVRQQVSIKVPTKPGARAEYEARLRADLAAVAAKVKQTVHVDVEVDKKGLGGSGGLSGIGSLLKNLGGGIPIVGRLASSLGGVIEAFQRVGGSAATAGGQTVGALSSMAGPVGSLVAALIGAAAAASAFVAGIALAVPVLGAVQAAIVATAGAAAALPGALTGIGAAVGTLALGFKGISEAFKPSSGGGGGGGAGGQAANQARQVASASRAIEAARRGIAAANRAYEASLRGVAAAERGLVAAQRAYAEAQEAVTKAIDRAVRSQVAVNRARRDAKENIEDLNRSLRGAVLSEQEAAYAVEDALLALDEARQTGDLRKIREAELAYERSKLQVEETADATGDLAAEADEASRKGVEGSDAVQDALRDQAEAWEAVEDAQQGVIDASNGIIDAKDALISAQDGVKSALDGQKAAADGLKSAQESLASAQQKVAAGGGGVAKEVTKLAPAAQKFVDAVKALKPAFESLRLDVQQRLFQGLDKTVTNLGNAWIPALRTTLGSYADTFNGFFKNLGASISQPEFIRNLQTGAEGFRRALEQVGEAITSKLVPAFGLLVKRSAPFLEKAGGLIAKAVTQFSNWIAEAEKSGKLESFFDTTAKAMGEIATTGKEAARLVGNIIRLLINGNGKNDKSAISSFNDGLKRINAFLEDPASQQKIQEFADSLKGIFTGFKQAYEEAKPYLDKLIAPDGDTTLTEMAGQAIGAALVAGFKEGVKLALEQAVDNWTDWFLNGDTSVVAWVRKLLGINSPSTVFMEIGSDVVAGFVKGIGDKLESLRKKAGEMKDRAVKAVAGAGNWLVATGRNAVTGLMNGLSQMYGSLKSRAGQAKTNVLNALNGAGNLLVNAGRNAINGLGNGLAQMYGTLRTRAGQAKSYILQALNGASSLLVTAGRNTVVGLFNGIASLGGWLWAKVTNFVQNNVTKAVNWALGVNSPSKVTMGIGRFVSQGLALGIEDEAAKVKAAADRVAAAAIPNVSGANFGLDLSAGAIASSLAVADRQQLLMGWKAGTTGDQILDAIAGHIDLRYRGDVQAALSRQ